MEGSFMKDSVFVYALCSLHSENTNGTIWMFWPKTTSVKKALCGRLRVAGSVWQALCGRLCVEGSVWKALCERLFVCTALQ